MATKETVWDAVRLMASVWRFPNEDQKATATAYHVALSDLSDLEVTEAVKSLMHSWTKTAPPKPADIRSEALANKPSNNRPLLPRPEPNHEDILRKIRVGSYHVNAIAQCGLADKTPDRWTREEWLQASKRQAELRRELGLPKPNTDNATLREKWT